MKVTITAGTHIGVVGCYGEKTINIKGDDTEDEVRKFIFDEFYDEITRAGFFEWKKEPGWHIDQMYSFVGPGGFTLIEYFYVKWV